ncbi:hypothetical protein GCM10007385_07430 [Tateyamaria omphalii]|uniref:hypothetical protein n=1 Tax=Tateyamaria omphalii TaxID=299262 RepID=UPI001676F110|nr:hypothetical protein [Tateyamaria omphalii]GGX42328.1 hypothetical protein GCM10007385_07430 [Tateyamaria omphalii]
MIRAPYSINDLTPQAEGAGPLTSEGLVLGAVSAYGHTEDGQPDTLSCCKTNEFC